jgi:two-component system C4-dicarboxylate transport sensor histidine kinase DctB
LLVALLWGVGEWTQRNELGLKIQALRHALDAHALGLQATAERFDFLPLASARHPAVQALLQSPQDPGAARTANAYLEDLNRAVGSSALYLMDRQGLTLAASNWRGADSFVGQNYRNRPYFEQALAGHRSLFYGVGLTTGVPGLFIAEPMRGAQGIQGVMVVKVGLDAVQSAWATAADPVVLSDARGIVFMSSIPAWLYNSRKPLSAGDIAWLNRNHQYGMDPIEYPVLPWSGDVPSIQASARPYRVQAEASGVRRNFLVAETEIPRLGWTLSVMADLSEVAQTRRIAQALTGLAVLLLLVSVLYWRLRERRLAEQRERAQEAQLQHAARLASLGEMASTLAHELGQPLMAVSSFAVAAQRFEEQGRRDLLQETLKDIQSQSRRAADIVARMRGFVRQRTRGQESCEMPEIISSVLALLRPELERLKCGVEIDIAPQLPPVRGDRLLLEQLLLNLLMNALQAMKDAQENARHLKIRARSRDQEVMVEVQDTGPGIPADAVPRLFEPFFSTKPDGLGLGLKICRSIAESHSGHLTFSAPVEGGALFTLTLPQEPCKEAC